MHLSEGILSGPVLVGGAAFAAVGVAAGLREMRDEDIPRTAVMTSVFFVASLVHVPIGPSSVHLILSGLCGILLGWRAFPALLVALFLQAILFGFGGLTVLGVNTFILAAPAAVFGAIARGWMRSHPDATHRAPLIAGAAAALAIACSGLLAAAALGLSQRSFIGAAGLIFAAHVPLMAVEGAITAGIAGFLLRVKPELLTDGGLSRTGPRE